MGMRRVIDQLTPLTRAWQTGGPETRRILRRIMQNAGKMLALEVGKRAPRKTGALENSPAARTQEMPEGLRTTIYIKTGSLNTTRPMAFLKFIHDGEYDLGAGSAAKQAGQQERVGDGFMDRALEDHQDTILQEIEDAFFRRVNGE